MSNLIGTKMSSRIPDCQVTKRCSLIVVACIVLDPGTRHGTEPTTMVDLSHYVMLLVLTNKNGRILAYYVAEERSNVMPAGL